MRVLHAEVACSADWNEVTNVVGTVLGKSLNVARVKVLLGNVFSEAACTHRLPYGRTDVKVPYGFSECSIDGAFSFLGL